MSDCSRVVCRCCSAPRSFAVIWRVRRDATRGHGPVNAWAETVFALGAERVWLAGKVFGACGRSGATPGVDPDVYGWCILAGSQMVARTNFLCRVWRSAAELNVAADSWFGSGCGWAGSVPGMERSKIEHVLSKAVVNAEAPPSDLALDAIVAGIPVDETRPPAADVDISWQGSGFPV